MKICLFSDIHGNIDALNGMFDVESDSDIFVFAGDIFGYFYSQKAVIKKFIQTPNLLAVLGNHDYNFINMHQFSDRIVDSYGSSYNVVLSKTQMQYICNLPTHIDTIIDGKRFGIFHGGVKDFLNERVYSVNTLDIDYLSSKYDYLILGHTHYRLVYDNNKLMIINPGSLGQPRDGYGFTYCVLNTNDRSFIFKTVDVNIKKIISEVIVNDNGRLVCDYLCQKYKIHRNQ